MSTFVGVFSNLLTEFINFKRSMGYKYITEAQTLAEFSRFTLQFELSKPVLTKEIVNAWCEHRPFENRRSSTEHRICILRQLALYLVSLGHKVCIPIHSRNNHQPRYAAYVFTHKEIKNIFESCDRVFPSRHSNMHLVMPVLIRLLYSSGLRISEAVGIQMKHVDLNNGVIEIKKAKNGKDRLIPLSSSMRDICIRYCQAIHMNSCKDDYFL